MYKSVTRCEVSLQKATRTNVIGLTVNSKAAVISFFLGLKEKLETGKKNLKTNFTTSKIQVLLDSIRTQRQLATEQIKPVKRK